MCREQAGTAPWQEALRRQVLLLRFRQLHPDDELNQLIWQPRIQKRYLKTDTARVEQKRKVKSSAVCCHRSSMRKDSYALSAAMSVVPHGSGEAGSEARAQPGDLADALGGRDGHRSRGQGERGERGREGRRGDASRRGQNAHSCYLSTLIMLWCL